ncbi:MAG: response regulator, partial [Gammaproteobacteria bacterium]
TGKAASMDEPERQALLGRLDGLSVLLVEDNPINQEVAHYLLVHAGAQVDIAANGRIAVSLLAERPNRYDAVLMDIQMPVMNGYQAAAEIRAMGLASLPIIAMTANAMEDDRVHAINAGMDGHVAKPIDVDRLVAAIRRLTSAGATRAGGRPILQAAPQSVTAVAAIAPALAPIPGIDLANTIARFGGHADKFVSVLKRFEASQGSALAEVRALVRAGLPAQAKPLMHRLRGVAANLGAVEVAALAQEAELALASADETTLASVLARLEQALATVFDGARRLPEAAAQAPLAHADVAALQTSLAELLPLLQNNNLKAIAAFGALRPALELALAPEQSAALAESVGSLAFANAAALVQDVMLTMEEAKGSA